MSTNENQPAPDEIKLASMAYIVLALRTCCCPGRWEDLPKSVQEAWIDVVRDLRRETTAPLRARIAELEAQLKQREPMDASSEHISPAVRVEERKRVPQVGDDIKCKYHGDLFALKVTRRGERGFYVPSLDPIGDREWWYTDSEEGDTWFWPAAEEKPAETPAADLKPYIWLGQRQGTHHMGKCLARMHLDQKHAAWLWPVLKQFSETGVLGNVKTTKRGRKS